MVNNSWDSVVHALFFSTVGCQTDVHKVGVSPWNHGWLNSPARPSKSKNLKTLFRQCCATPSTDWGIIDVLRLALWHCSLEYYRVTVLPFESTASCLLQALHLHLHDNDRPFLHLYFSFLLLARSSNSGVYLAFYGDHPHHCTTLSGALDWHLPPRPV